MTINVQHNQDCGHCDRKRCTCAMFLASGETSLPIDPPPEVEIPFYLCMQCISDAGVAIASAIHRRDKVTVNVRTGTLAPVNASAGCKYCGKTCVNEACDDCARREYPR